MFLVVYANHLAPQIPVDLVNGPLVIGASLIVEMADGTHHDAIIEKDGEAETIILDVAGDRWRLERRPVPVQVVLTATKPIPTEHWIITGRAKA